MSQDSVSKKLKQAIAKYQNTFSGRSSGQLLSGQKGRVQLSNGSFVTAKAWGDVSPGINAFVARDNNNEYHVIGQGLGVGRVSDRVNAVFVRDDFVDEVVRSTYKVAYLVAEYNGYGTTSILSKRIVRAFYSWAGEAAYTLPPYYQEIVWGPTSFSGVFRYVETGKVTEGAPEFKLSLNINIRNQYYWGIPGIGAAEFKNEDEGSTGYTYVDYFSSGYHETDITRLTFSVSFTTQDTSEVLGTSWVYENSPYNLSLCGDRATPLVIPISGLSQKPREEYFKSFLYGLNNGIILIDIRVINYKTSVVEKIATYQVLPSDEIRYQVYPAGSTITTNLENPQHVYIHQWEVSPSDVSWDFCQSDLLSLDFIRFDNGNPPYKYSQFDINQQINGVSFEELIKTSVVKRAKIQEVTVTPTADECQFDNSKDIEIESIYNPAGIALGRIPNGPLREITAIAPIKAS